jgi:mono/diheme cytochrome c family protein
MRRSLAPFVVLTAVAGLGLGAAACGGSSSPSGTIAGTITIGTDKVVTVSSGAGGAATSGGGGATTGGTATGSTGGATTGGGATGDAAAGKAVFTANCGGCHSLKDAATSGQVGPDLDQLKPSAATVQTQVTNGGAAMPAFKGTLSDADIANVAAYVSSVAGQ